MAKKSQTPKSSKSKAPTNELKQARVRARLSRREVARELRTKLSAIDDIERGKLEFRELDIYQQGLVRAYARLVDVDVEPLLSSTESEEKPQKPQDVTLQRRFKLLRGLVATRSAAVLAGLSGLLIALGLAAFLLVRLLAAPTLQIESPTDQQTVSGTYVDVAGKTSAGSDVFINGTPVLVDLEGSFNEQVLLAEGLNRIEIKAVNSLSREAIVTRTIVADYPELEELEPWPDMQ